MGGAAEAGGVRLNVEVAEETVAALPEYARIPISFEVKEVLDPRDLAGTPGRRLLTLVPATPPFVKDYDAVPGYAPLDWSKRFDMASWTIFMARSDGTLVGGAAVRRRNDLAVLWDLRVAPSVRHLGVGTALLGAVDGWARRNEITWLEVETQNVNVPAYRFYLHNGFTLTDARPNEYPEFPEEVQLLLHRKLPGPHAIPDAIETPRLVLRRWRKHEAAQLKAAIDDNLEHLQAWMPWAMDEPSAMDVIEDRIARFEEQFDSGLEWLFAIRSRETDAVLGGMGVHPRLGPTGLEIGYWLQASATGKGHATEAADALTRVALQQPGIERVQIRCDPKNVASAGIPRRLGYRHVLTIENETFAPAGSLRDTMVWETKRP